MEIIVNTDLFCSSGVSIKITNTKEERGLKNLNLSERKWSKNRIKLKKTHLNLSRVKHF